MGNTLSSKLRQMLRKTETNILMLGLDAAGKTTILYMLKLGEIVTTIPTIGFNVETLQGGNEHFVSFTTWDVGGRDKIRPLWRHFYQGCNAVVFVVDSNDRDRMPDARDELLTVLNEEALLGAPVLVLANKQDLPSALSVAEVTEQLGLRDLRRRRWHIRGCCATNKGDGVTEGLDWLSATVHTGKAGSRVGPPDDDAAPGQPDRKAGAEGSEAGDTESTADTDAAEAGA